jgi:hypothetical protein
VRCDAVGHCDQNPSHRMLLSLQFASGDDFPGAIVADRESLLTSCHIQSGSPANPKPPREYRHLAITLTQLFR